MADQPSYTLGPQTWNTVVPAKISPEAIPKLPQLTNIHWSIWFFGILQLALDIMILLMLAVAPVHAEPSDPCGTGMFYNKYSNECIPTDRGAWPQPKHHNPGSNDGVIPGGSYGR